MATKAGSLLLMQRNVAARKAVTYCYAHKSVREEDFYAEYEYKSMPWISTSSGTHLNMHWVSHLGAEKINKLIQSVEALSSVGSGECLPYLMYVTRFSIYRTSFPVISVV